MRHVLVIALCTVATTMTFAQSSKQVFPNANASLPFSTAIKADGLIYVSGTLGSGGDVKAQTKQVLDNISAALKTAGSSLANAASMTVYLKNQSDFAAMNEVYREFFPDAPPARATVQSGLAGPEAVVEITFVASSASRNAIGTPPSGLPLSPAIRAGRHLFVSGMLGNSPDTAGDVAAQTRATLSRIDATLRDAGLSRGDVVDALVYITDAASFGAMNGEYRAFFGTDFPARATVVTPLVAPDGLVEIMVTAVVPDAGASGSRA